MAQPGYSYGPGPDEAASKSNALAGAGAAGVGANPADATNDAFDQNRRTIPGLGLGYFGTAERPTLSQSKANGNQKSNRKSPAPDDSVEEGEIDEDDFADLYESQEPAPVEQQELPLPEIDTSYVEMSEEERDRSGSYSPFLSAGEMEIERPEVLHRLPAAATVEKQTTSLNPIAEAKNKAKEAILRLHAANIRYEDYISEGIDKGVLDQLFSDLGLGQTGGKATPAVQPVTQAPSTKESVVQGANRATNAAVDKAEERKDRIARLLAAKGSKAPKSGGGTVIGKVAKVPNTKVNLEKSKLLQQKMEALLKAREEKQKELERQAAAAGLVAQESILPVDTETRQPADSISGLQIPAASDQATKSSTSEVVTSASSPAKAVGMTQSGSGSGNASDGPFQKPFGPTRPFLIDVSDDDEDMDMEIESPEQNLSSLHAPTSPSRKQALAPSLLQSPGSQPTPPSGRHDLDNINQKIEAMKRKIAEAEAKKRLKLSAPASPAASPRPKAFDLYESKSSSPDISAAHATSGRLPKLADNRIASPGSPKINRSRAASERLPMLESRRKEQLLRLKALQSQVANIERELKEGFEEEQKLREDLDYISDDDVAITPAHDAVTPQIAHARVPSEPLIAADNGPMNPVDILSSDHIVTESSSASSPAVVAEDSPAAAQTEPKPNTNIETRDQRQPAPAPAKQPTQSENYDGDVAMDEATSSGEEADDDSDDYEPAEASLFETTIGLPDADISTKAPELTDSDPAVAALSAELLSAGRQDSASPPDAEREVVPASRHFEWPKLMFDSLQVHESAPEEAASGGSSFLPYDSPLRYFHSYRFHPDFGKAVAGGLRSATYSNKIDAKQPLCPDEAAGKPCPRGPNCHFQHFAEMSAPGKCPLSLQRG